MDRTSAKEFVSLLYYLITFFFLFFFFFLQRTVLHREKSNRFTPRTRFPIFFPSLSRELLCMHLFFLSSHSYFSFLLTSLSHPYYIFISWSLSLLSSKGFNSSFTIFISLFFFLNCLQIYNSAVRRARFEDKKQGLKNRTVACAIKYIY